MQHLWVALQYEEAFRCRILIKCNSCNFTLWISCCFGCSKQSPHSPSARPWSHAIFKFSGLFSVSATSRDPVCRKRLGGSKGVRKGRLGLTPLEFDILRKLYCLRKGDWLFSYTFCLLICRLDANTTEWICKIRSCKPWCAPAKPAVHLLCSTVCIGRDISAGWFCSCTLLDVVMCVFYSLFQRAAWYFCSYELLCRSVKCIFLRYPNLERWYCLYSVQWHIK